jgi:hypothetical protein
MDIIQFIQATPALKSLVRYHNINKLGVPSSQIKRVPSLVTKENNILVGAEVKNWLMSIMPCDFKEYQSAEIGMANLDQSDGDNFFALDNYGVSLKPEVTAELQARIDADPSSLYNNLKK